MIHSHSLPKDKTHIIYRIKYLLNELGIPLTDEEVHPKLYLGNKENIGYS